MTRPAQIVRSDRERPAVSLPTGIASLVIALLGLGVSIYLTLEHYAASTVLACPENSVINCAKVTTSSYATMGPIPVALLGALYFAAMAALCLPAAWRMPWLDTARVLGATIGVLSSLYLVWVEVFRLEAICLWCTVVHLSTLVLLGVILWTVTGLRSAPERGRSRPGEASK